MIRGMLRYEISDEEGTLQYATDKTIIEMNMLLRCLSLINRMPMHTATVLAAISTDQQCLITALVEGSVT